VFEIDQLDPRSKRFGSAQHLESIRRRRLQRVAIARFLETHGLTMMVATIIIIIIVMNMMIKKMVKNFLVPPRIRLGCRLSTSPSEASEC
jgi:hypothetical protein